MNKLLQTVVTDAAGQGTMRNYALKNSVLFAKTGTTTDDYDRWVIGGTPYYVAAVWFGCDIQKSLSNYVSGNPSGKIFDEVMNRVHKNLERKDFETHSPIVEQHAYCTATGLLASDNCPSKAMGWYSKNNMPGYCVSCGGSASAQPATDANGDGGEATTAAPAGETTTAAPATTAPVTEPNTGETPAA